RFPSSANGKGFKPLADYIHSKGLKFGIHIMRGIPMEAVKRNLPILHSNVTAQQVYNDDRLCTWLHDMYSLDASKEGAQEYYNSIFELYASWGLDFVKVDDLSSPYHKEEIEMIRKAIDRTGRKIVFSTSPGETPITEGKHVGQHANMWRTVGDFWDSWQQLKEHFEVCNRWAPFISSGAWPDADMLPLGRIGIRAERGANRISNFTKDEQYTLMTLWSIFHSPLMFGGDLPSNDAFTLSLLTNKDVLYVNKCSKNNRQLFRKDDQIAWIADDPRTGDKFLAVFNAADQVQILENKAAWSSGLINKQTPGFSRTVDLDITGATKLYLTVNDGGDGNDWDHADWIDPVLYRGNDSIALTSLKWSKATTGWGQVCVNKSVSEADLIVDGKKYDNGIGVHANSVIEYDLPEGVTRFKAKAGLDNACVSQNVGASVKFMVFTQDPAGPVPAETVKIPVLLKNLGIHSACKVHDLWSGKDLGVFKGNFIPTIKRHGCGLYRISVVK
ncbi:MAG: NPCBM/NEW2 domain-containing protein, partial [Bacteroidota bacterium]|nr:NPCBM/NEW2 domain-containing protein [Bacteroidota bacterium]